MALLHCLQIVALWMWFCSINAYGGNGSVIAKSCDYPNNGIKSPMCYGRTTFPTLRLQSESSIQNPCHLTLSNESIALVAKHVHAGMQLLVLILRFPQQKDCIQMNSVFNYSVWIWTFAGSHGVVRLLNEPFDYDVLSFGLLTLRVRTIPIDVVSQNKDCNLTLGFSSTNLQISTMLHRSVLKGSSTKHMATQRRSDIKSKSLYCYLTISNTRQSDMTYYMAHLFGITVSQEQYSMFNCCKPFLVNRESNASRIECVTVYRLTAWVRYLQCLAIFLFAYSPLLLIFALGSSVDDESLDIGTNTHHLESSHPTHWIAKHTFTVEHMTKYVVSIGGKSVLASRIRRFVFVVIVVPSITVLRLTLMYIYKYPLYESRLQADAPIGLMSMFFGFNASVYNYKCFLGGPYIILGTYFTLGVVFLCIPHSLSKLFCKELQDDDENLTFNSPLFFNVKLLEKFASVDVSNFRGYRRFHNGMLARLFALMNVKFWYYCCCVWMLRFKKAVKCLHVFNLACNKAVARILYIPALVFILCVHVIAVLFEFAFVIISYAFPILYFMYVLYFNYLNYLYSTFIPFSYRRRRSRVVSVLNFIFSIIILILFFVIMFGYITFTTATIRFIFSTIRCTLLGVVIHARRVAVYCLVILIFLIYIWKASKGLLEDYDSLFILVVNISQYTRQYMANKRHINRDNVSHESIITDQISDRAPATVPIPDTVAMNSQYGDFPTVDQDVPFQAPFVKYIGGLAYIPEDLFQYIVEKHRPFRNQILLTSVKVILTCFIISLIWKSVIDFERVTTFESIMMVFSMLLTGYAPLLLNVFASPMTEQNKKWGYQLMVRQSILDYWRRSSVSLED